MDSTPARSNRYDLPSSMVDPSSPAPFYSSAVPNTPQRNRYRRSEFSSSLLGDDIAPSSPLVYPSTPYRGGNMSQLDSPQSVRTPRHTTYVRTPFSNSQFAAGSPATPVRTRDALSNLAVGNADTQESDPSLSVRIIWGTSVNTYEVMACFKNFLQHFKLADRKNKFNEPTIETDYEPFYPKLLAKVYISVILIGGGKFC